MSKYDDIRFAENEFSVARAVEENRERKRKEAAERWDRRREADYVRLDEIEARRARARSSGYPWK